MGFTVAVWDGSFEAEGLEKKPWSESVSLSILKDDTCRLSFNMKLQSSAVRFDSL